MEASGDQPTDRGEQGRPKFDIQLKEADFVSRQVHVHGAGIPEDRVLEMQREHRGHRKVFEYPCDCLLWSDQRSR